jgi:DNA modification methylase
MGIIQGNALDKLKEIKTESINCIVTSPPYWGLRDYGVEGQLGLEKTFEEYIDKLCTIFDEAKRVLRKDGTLWVNLGDTYWGGGNNRGSSPENLSAKQFSNRGARGQVQNKWDDSYQSKSLCLIPFRFAIEMVNRGWICRNVIIWHKPNCMPSSAKDRFTVDFEYLFFFVKNKKYWFSQQFENGSGGFSIVSKTKKYSQSNGHSNRMGLDREPTYRERRVFEILQNNIANYLKKYIKGKEYQLDNTFGQHKWRHWIRTDESGASLPCPDDWLILKDILDFDNQYDEQMTKTEIYLDDGTQCINQGRNKRTVWTIPTKPYPECHFAVYPAELIRTCIKAGCPKGGVVLDPFAGSGTTLEEAIRQGKDYIGIELKDEYIELIEKRLSKVQVNLI